MAAQTHLIVEKLLRRDKAALSELYAETSSKAYGIILALIESEHLATQTLRELYLDIWKAPRAELDGALPAQRQVLLLARRRALDVIATNPGMRRNKAADSTLTKPTPEITRQLLKTAYLHGEGPKQLAKRFDMTPQDAQTKLWTDITQMKKGDPA